MEIKNLHTMEFETEINQGMLLQTPMLVHIYHLGSNDNYHPIPLYQNQMMMLECLYGKSTSEGGVGGV